MNFSTLHKIEANDKRGYLVNNVGSTFYGQLMTSLNELSYIANMSFVNDDDFDKK